MLKIFFLFFLSTTLYAKEGYVVHPAPKAPKYLSESLYDSFASQFPAPPAAGSPEQKQDEAGILKAQKERKPADCERANTEILVSLDSFFGPKYGPLDESATKTLSPFFEQIRNDGDFFIQKFKVAYPRPRPFTYLKGVYPCVPKEVTGAYPSGHAVLSRLYYLILSDFYPQNRSRFEQRATQIATDRVLSGVHHPSDVWSGQKLGDSIYLELKKSDKFRQDFDAQKRALTTANRG